MRCHLLFYRIPKVRNRRGQERDLYPNPSPQLRRRGFRVDGSVWVIPSHLLPWSLMNDMKGTPGVVCQEAEFSQEEAKKLIDLAKVELLKNATDAVNAVTKKGDIEYDKDGREDETEEEFELRKARGIRAEASKARRLLADFRAAGEGFGLTPEELNLDSAESQVRIMHLISGNKAKIWADAVKALKATRQRELAAAGEADELPAYVLADALRDEGLDEQADEIQETFMGAASA